jgi:hypothetical protein
MFDAALYIPAFFNNLQTTARGGSPSVLAQRLILQPVG